MADTEVEYAINTLLYALETNGNLPYFGDLTHGLKAWQEYNKAPSRVPNVVRPNQRSLENRQLNIECRMGTLEIWQREVIKLLKAQEADRQRL